MALIECSIIVIVIELQKDDIPIMIIGMRLVVENT